jgi:hypothetical protein
MLSKRIDPNDYRADPGDDSRKAKPALWTKTPVEFERESHEAVHLSHMAPLSVEPGITDRVKGSS